MPVQKTNNSLRIQKTFFDGRKKLKRFKENESKKAKLKLKLSINDCISITKIIFDRMKSENLNGI